MCDHLRETVTRYDRERKLLILLLVCSSCRDDAVVGTLPYEPAFTRGVLPA
jgi:hypothetical protein